MEMIGIQVRDPAGKPPSVRRAFVRALVMGFSIAILFLGYLPVLFDRRRRGLPDIAAGTEVVYAPQRTAS